LRSCSVPFQQQDATFPIHCIKCLPKIKEDTVKRLQLKVQELLGQFSFDNSGSRPVVVATAMVAAVQLNGIQPMVNHPLGALPNGLQ
jgi:hypothetical protein